MILTRVFILTGNTRLIVGIEVYPKIETKIFLENKNNVKIDFTEVTEEEFKSLNLEHGVNKIGNSSPISISRLFIGDNRGFKMAQGNIHIFVVEDTMHMVQEIFSLAKEYEMTLTSKLDMVEQCIKSILEKLKVSDIFDTAMLAISSESNTEIEKEMILKTKILMKMVKDKFEEEKKKRRNEEEEEMEDVEVE